MHDFPGRGRGGIAHEAYFDTGLHQIYPVGPNPKSSALYRQLF
jgi:hypothetical protein